ncbi:MAG: Saxitoxin biosynthesis operon protein SxtJ [Candidatus Parcubacteria bacterium]|jgi:hypothetical protein
MKVLKKFWKVWMRIAKPIGNFQARVLFSIFYFFLFFFVAMPLRLFGDPLKIHDFSFRKRSSFTKWEHEIETVEEARKPF